MLTENQLIAIVLTLAVTLVTIDFTFQALTNHVYGQTIGNDPEDLYEDEAIICVDKTVIMEDKHNSAQDGLICHIYKTEDLGINDTINQKLFDLNDSFDMEIKD